MKQLISLTLLLFIGRYTHAGLGSSATFSGFTISKCGSESSSLATRYTVVDQTSHNKMATIRIEQFQNNVVEISEIISPILDGENLRTKYDVSSYCASVTGVVEEMSVPAGTFWTCKLSIQTSDGWEVQTWAGGAPLGLIAWQAKKVEFNDPSCLATVDQRLTEFNF